MEGMGFRFRRSVKLMPGVRLNFGRRGTSTTIGRRGASVTFGKRGTYANVGLPGTGVSYRERLDLPADHRPAPRARGGANPVVVLIVVALGIWALAALLS
jgi:hypothetical protein